MSQYCNQRKELLFYYDCHYEKFVIRSCTRLTFEPLSKKKKKKKKSGTRSIPEVKLCRARRVLGRVTRLEIPRVVDCFFFFFFITRLTCFGCFKRDVLFCQASVKIKFSTLSVHCYITFMLSSTEKCLACFPQCLLRTF